MNDQSEAARGSASSHWFGLDRLRLSGGDQSVDITIGTERHWDRSHLRRLRQSGDLPGMVPIIDSDFSADGKPFAVTPVIDQPTLATLIDSGDLDWVTGAAITEAAARASHEAHLRGLFHGALSTEDVYVIDGDVAIAGVGLGLGGIPPAERAQWVSPEVREGAEPTERSDVYSLGKVLESSLGSSLDSVPRSIRRLIMWSSSDTPEARPPSAMEFASILSEGLGEDRATYGPAFIPTADATDLVSRASSAVANHTPSPTAQATEQATGRGLAGAGLAAATSAFLAGSSGSGAATPEQEADEVDPATELDEPAAGTDLDETVEAEVVDPSPPASDEEVAVDEGAAPAPPPAAETMDLERPQPARRGNRAGIAVGAILVVGLIAILWGLLGPGGDEESADGSPASDSQVLGSTATSQDVTSNTAGAAATEDGSATTDAGTGTTAEPATSTTAGTGTTAEPATSTTAATAPPSSDVVTAGDAQLATIAEAGSSADVSDQPVQLLHGLPDTEVDVYVDGEAAAVPGIGFEAGTIAELDLEPGDHEIELFAASEAVPRRAGDRTDTALAAGTVSVGTDPMTIVAHLDQAGDPMISMFAEDVAPLEPGTGRLVVRNLMAGEEVAASVNGEVVVDSLAPGEEQVVPVEAGTMAFELLGSDGSVIEAHPAVGVSDGELVSLSAIGDPSEGTAQVMIQTYAGLSSAPVAVPTGDSGLLDTGDGGSGLWIVYGLMVSLVVAGGVIAVRRQRSLS